MYTSDNAHDLMKEISANPDITLDLLRKLGVEPDFSLDSLKKIEKKLVEAFPHGFTMPTTMIPFGWYLGECIIRAIPGAKWGSEHTNDLSECIIEIDASHIMEGMTSVVKPMIRIDKFMDDNTDSLWVLVETIRKVNTGEIDILKMQSGEWEHQPDGTTVRTVVEVNEK